MKKENHSGKAANELTERLVNFIVHTKDSSLPEKLITLAKRAVLDTVGVSIAGWQEPAVEIAKKVYRSFYQISHDFPSSLWGEDLKVLPTDAAIINGTASHALDYDDAMSTVILHPSAPVLAAVLPIAEDLKSSGKDVITAYAVGTEVMIRLTEIIGVRHYSVGWHSTGTIGTLGATAALVNLYRLDENQCINALAIAGSMAGGLRKNFGTMTKPLHVGLAASHAIQAVQLAKENFTANHDLFGDEGIFHAFTGQTEFFEKKAITTAFGEPFALIESGLSVKKFPCCFGTHRFIQGALELKEAHGLELSAIKKIILRAQPKTLMPLIHHSPKNGLEAKFSAEYTVLAALKDGYVDLTSFLDQSVLREEIQQLLPFVKLVPKNDKQVKGVNINLPVDIEIHTKSNEIYKKSIRDAPGSKAHPLSDKEYRQKWKSCFRYYASKQANNRHLEKLNPLADVLYQQGMELDSLATINSWLDEIQQLWKETSQQVIR